MANRNIMMLAIAGGAIYLFMNRSSGPVFKDSEGNIVSEVLCGDAITFDVPGQTAIWLDQLQNGMLQWSAPIELPYGPHTLNCTSEPGLYQSAAYELLPDYTKGKLLGQTELRVLI